MRELVREHPTVYSGTQRGFSVLELLAVAAIIAVVSAISFPSLMQSWNIYRLNRTAADVGSLLRLARSEAIRHNTTIRCLGQQQANGSWLIGIDLNNNGTIEPTEPQVVLVGPATVVPAGTAPNPSSMGYPGAQTPSGSIAFAPRGEVNYGPNPPVVYVVYFGILNQPKYGFRAVTVMPFGTVKYWTAAAGGSWQPSIP